MSDSSKIPTHHQPFVYVPECILSIPGDELNSTQKLILGVIASKQLLNDRACTLSNESIADMVGVRYRAVSSAISQLKAKGYVVCDSRPGQTNRLNINDTKIRELLSGERVTCDSSSTDDSASSDDLRVAAECHPGNELTLAVECQGGGSQMPPGVVAECHQREEGIKDKKENSPFIPSERGDIIFPFDDAPGFPVNFVEVDSETEDDNICPPGKRKRDSPEWFNNSKFGEFMKTAFPRMNFADHAQLVELMDKVKRGLITCEMLAKKVMTNTDFRKHINLDRLIEKFIEDEDEGYSYSALGEWRNERDKLISKYQELNAALPDQLNFKNTELKYALRHYHQLDVELRKSIAWHILIRMRKIFDPNDSVTGRIQRQGKDINGQFSFGSCNFQRCDVMLVAWMSVFGYDSTFNEINRSNFLRDVAMDGMMRNTLLQFPDELIVDLWHIKFDMIKEAYLRHCEELEERMRRFGLDLSNLPAVDAQYIG